MKIQWFIRFSIILFCVILSACGGGSSGKAVDTSEAPEAGGESAHSIGSNQYTSIEMQANLADLEYTRISTAEFVEKYFQLSTQTSSTQFMISNDQTFVIPENTISFSLNFFNPLAGSDLYMVELENPSGDKIDLQDLIPCFSEFCSMVMPNRPQELYRPEVGTWKYRVVAEKSVVERQGLGVASLNLYIRTTTDGQKPDENGPSVATLTVQPFYTGSDISGDYITSVMNSFVGLFARNYVAIEFKPAIHITDERFSSIVPDYTHEKTQQMLQYGKASDVNLYFVRTFDFGLDSSSGYQEHPRMDKETRTLLGIAPGIPGSLGKKGSGNGVLIGLGSGDGDSYALRSSSYNAKVAAHEVGHFLGLFHTTEGSGGVDVLEDTPICKLGEDSGVLPDAAECPDGTNLMFPYVRSDGVPQEVITEHQRFVIYNSPLAH